MHDLVADTNILVSALRSRRGASQQILRMIGQGVFTLHISVALALEYEEVLKRTNLIPGINATDVDAFLDYLFRTATLVPSVYPHRPSLSDPDDELVLDLAVQRRAAILTYNKRDFSGALKYGITILTPGEFLERLRNTT